MYCKAKKNSEQSENFWKKKISKNFGSLRIFFCITIHNKLNKSYSLDKIFLFLKKKVVSLKKNSFEILWSEVRKGGFQFLWKMVLWGATYNAVVVVGVVSLLLFRLPMAILWGVIWHLFLEIWDKVKTFLILSYL